MKKYKNIIFDIDGTILNTANMNIYPLIKLIKEEKEIDMTYESLLFALGLPGKKTLEILGFNNIDKSYEKWVQYVNEYEKKATLYDGIKDIIKHMHSKNIICGIVSSKNKSQYEIDFMPTGLHECMNAIVLEEDTKYHKPHPEPLKKVMEILNINPYDTLYVGDSISDYNCSKNCEVDFALALWGAVDKNINATISLNEPSDILNFI
ncbi:MULTISPECIES: HAD family hydrolase [Romboutsia]|uniref:Phosphatase n=1 Tax=Romboutsia hominis TaxID=1507512 RepID=A0A2P2BR42_9FIRM|nr:MULTISPECIES: HAD-IA family hydrolase [Romboutsia]MCH1960176.1 HAD family hydrolase [Romboutsia hominis]MCH1969389.1 HAD family hydrolase [Romboutsia hominis]MDB8790609.1 HAD-IA family hydrolase [Romboutsia sp. 1001216sp1]MDB8801343.1 HAD-IA family hydrolase [Romboutsia sp. 1001216sp1]MDB8812741.1 HAD-IA family hydrolase [Romboutsia sp. 1001216sp1]